MKGRTLALFKLGRLRVVGRVRHPNQRQEVEDRDEQRDDQKLKVVHLGQGTIPTREQGHEEGDAGKCERVDDFHSFELHWVGVDLTSVRFIPVVSFEIARIEPLKTEHGLSEVDKRKCEHVEWCHADDL